MLESENHRVPQLPEQKAEYQSYASYLPEGKLEAIVSSASGLREPVLLACSGGGDSVFLGECLRLAGAEFSIAHVNHHLRPGAHRDEEFVRRLARWWGVDGHFFHEFPINDGDGIEASAREARYQVLIKRCREVGGALMTGHTASDQLETLFMRLGRGTGLRGVPGIHGRLDLSGVLVLRPMLELWRDDIRRALLGVGMPWVDDPSNDSGFALRNRVRSGVAAAFRQEFSESATGRSLRLIMEEAELYRALMHDKAMALTPRIEPGAVRVERSSLLGIGISNATGEATYDHSALIRSVLADLFGHAGVPFDERLLNEIEGSARLGDPFVATGHGVRVECDGRWLEARGVDAPSVPFSRRDASEVAEIDEIGLFDMVDQGPQAVGEYVVDVRRTTAGMIPARRDLSRNDDDLEYFDEASLDPHAAFRRLGRSDVWIAADGKRRNAWDRAKRDGMNVVARRSGVVLAADTDVYWLLDGRRSALAWVTDETSSIIAVHIRQRRGGVEAP